MAGVTVDKSFYKRKKQGTSSCQKQIHVEQDVDSLMKDSLECVYPLVVVESCL